MIADRISRIELSPTLRISAKAKAMEAEGIDVIDMSVGEPDFPTPDNVKEAGIRAIQENFTKYTANEGIPELKKAIVRQFDQDHGLKYEPRQIIVGCGAKQCLYNLAVALFNVDDEVIIPAPYWVSYPQQVLLPKAKPVYIQTRAEDGFRIPLDRLKAAISGKTKAIILNYPSNPTGMVYNRQELEALADVILSEGLYVIADEIYQKIVYDGRQFVSIATLDKEIFKRTIVINGVSKAYSMTGWRIGWAAGPWDVINAMAKVQSHSTSNPTSVAQKAAVEALNGPQFFIARMAAEFEKRRNFVMYRLGAVDGVSCFEPEGAFYVFPNIANYLGRSYESMNIRNSIDLSYYLLKHHHVAVVPGAAFGADDFMRLSFATSMENLEAGLSRIAEGLGKLRHAPTAPSFVLDNVYTARKGLVAVKSDLTLAQRDEMLRKVSKNLRYDETFEWNVNINGIVVKLVTNNDHLYDFWMENWYPAQLETDLEPHGTIYALTGVPGEAPSAHYSPVGKTGFIFNSAYYGQVRAMALGLVADVGEMISGTHSVRASCVVLPEGGVLVIGPKGTDKAYHVYGLAGNKKTKIHSDEWVYIDYRGGKAVADISERKYYVRTDIAEPYPMYTSLFDRAKCENVVSDKTLCENASCKAGGECRLDEGRDFCYWASKDGRAMLDPYWIGGAEKYAKRTEIKRVLILTRERSGDVLESCPPERAFKILEEGKYPDEKTAVPYFNPYMLAAGDDRKDLQRRLFQTLLTVAPCTLVHVGSGSKEEVRAALRDVLLGK